MNEATFLHLAVEFDDETNDMVLVDRVNMTDLIRLHGSYENQMLLERVASLLNRFAEDAFNRGKQDQIDRARIGINLFRLP